MGFMNKLLGGNKDQETRALDPQRSETEAVVECIHGTLIPRWDRVEDMGREDLVSVYICESCTAELTPEEAREAKEKGGERIRV